MLLYSESFAAFGTDLTTILQDGNYTYNLSLSFAEIAQTGGYANGPNIIIGGNSSTQGAQYIVYTMPTAPASNAIRFGLWYKLDATTIQGPGTAEGFVHLMNTAEDRKVLFRFTTLGKINVTNYVTASGSSTVYTDSSSVDFRDLQWHYIEAYVVIGTGTSGTIQVWIDGQLGINQVGINTNPSSLSGDATGFTKFRVGGALDSGTLDSRISSIMVWDASGSYMNGYIGPARIEVVRPNGAGTNTGFTPSAGSNYQCVDEATSNIDTDYVEHAIAATKDTYNYESLASSPSTILAVNLKGHVKNVDVGSASMRQLCLSGGATANGSDVALTLAYKRYSEVFYVDPNTSAAWTFGGVNAAEFGIEVR